MSAQQIIDRLELLPHPEGGWYREMYRSQEEIPEQGLPDRFPASRSQCTHIYYLLEGEQISHYHRIKSDELWHFYDGSRLDVHMIGAGGALSKLQLSRSNPFGYVPAETWFAACIPDEAFALVGCTVAPGFDFADFEMADRAHLLAAYPNLHDEILRFT